MKSSVLLGTLAVLLVAFLVVSFSPGISNNSANSENSLASLKFSNVQILILIALAVTIFLIVIILFLENRKK